MLNKCQQAFYNAASKVAKLPQDYLDLKIKNNIPNQDDWDDVNRAFCADLDKIDCTIVESELDPFWKRNTTFRELLEYIEKNCDCSS